MRDWSEHSKLPSSCDTPPQSSSDESDEEARVIKKIMRREERREKFLRRLPIKIGAFTLALSSISTAYWSDVAANEQIESNAAISVTTTTETQEAVDADSAVLFIDGFNAYDATYLSGTLGPFAQSIQSGSVLSLNYNNGVLNRDEILEKVKSYAAEHGITKLSVIGYSMGGIIATELAADLNSKSDIEVPYLAAIETPYGNEGLRPYQQNELAFGQWVTNHVAGSEYSSWARNLGEIYFRRGQYTTGNIPTDIGQFIGATNDVLTRPRPHNLTTTRLLMQQIYKIAHVDFKKEFETIYDNHAGKIGTTAAYFRTTGYDDVVNDEFSGYRWCADAASTNISCDIFTVEGAQHSLYFNAQPAFQAAFEDAAEVMLPEIAANESLAQVRRSLIGQRATRIMWGH